jgi:predicted amidohydrolase YtcJ
MGFSMTTIIRNARIYVRRGRFCQALMIHKDRIVRTGTNEDIFNDIPPGTENIDAGGALVLPAFHDSHLHLQWVGRREGSIEAAGARSVEEVLERGRALIEAQKPPPGTYIQGAGVNPDLFTGEKRDLTRYDLDTLSREHPIIISRHCGHTIYCNSLALERAGFGESAPPIEGGEIEVDDRGRPTGIARENANALIRKPMPELTDGEIKNNFERAMKKCLSLGITAAGSYDTSGDDYHQILGIYRELYGEEGPHVRITMQCGIQGQEQHLDRFLREGYLTGKVLLESPGGAPLLTMGPLKLFIDGTLGGRTAWMSAPYHDGAETSGFPVIDPEFFTHLVKKAAGAGMQVMVHAIGDAGIDAALRTFEGVTEPGKNPLRHGLIHSQITTIPLIERMARHDIQVLAQPIFLADDLPILESRVGPDLALSSYAWGSMERLGVRVSYGTDGPVSALDPLLCIHWAVNRTGPHTGNPPGGYNPGERVDRYTAVDNYTAASAYSGFDENRMGRIAPGFLADLVILDRDIFSIPPDEIYRARVLRTLSGGRTVYERS